MKKTQKKKSQKPSGKSSGETSETPVALLKQDHQKVKELFKRFEKSEDDEEKEEIAQEAITELKVHTTLEEELFYPAAQEEVGEDEEDAELLKEANEEHYVAKFLISELENMDISDENYCAKFTVLAENVKHHIQEEEGELFPEVKQTEANSEELGRRMIQRKAELQREMGEQEEE